MHERAHAPAYLVCSEGGAMRALCLTRAAAEVLTPPGGFVLERDDSYPVAALHARSDHTAARHAGYVVVTDSREPGAVPVVLAWTLYHLHALSLGGSAHLVIRMEDAMRKGIHLARTLRPRPEAVCA